MTLNPIAPLNARVPEWTFAERLRKARRDCGWTQAHMAELLDVKPSTYEAWETGRNRPDVAAVAEDLEIITGITRMWFVGWVETGSHGPNGGGANVRPSDYIAPVTPGPWPTNARPSTTTRATTPTTGAEAA